MKTEINSIKITSKSLNFIVCTIYRPHSKHVAVQDFTDLLVSLLHKDDLKNSKIVLLGDININLLEHKTHAHTNNFLTTLQASNFFLIFLDLLDSQTVSN